MSKSFSVIDSGKRGSGSGFGCRSEHGFDVRTIEVGLGAGCNVQRAR